MPNLRALAQVKDGLRRLAGEIARELQEQRRQAVRSLRVVSLNPPQSMDTCWIITLVVRRGQV